MARDRPPLAEMGGRVEGGTTDFSEIRSGALGDESAGLVALADAATP